MTAPDIRAALVAGPARDVLMLTLVGEAAGESHLGRVGVACCIRNRVLTDLHHDGKPDWWGEGYHEVCLKKWQFSCWWELTAPNTLRLYALAESVLARAVAPASRPLVDALYLIADSVIDGTTDDITNGANHYITHRLLAAAPPAWARASAGRPAPTPCAHIGSHAYFRLEVS